MDSQKMIIDELMPDYDVVLVQHLLVSADPATTFKAAKDLDFLTIRTPLTDTAMLLRGLPDRLRGREQKRPARLDLARGIGLPGWLSLGERTGQEVVFGAVGKLWQGSIEWRDTSQAEFAGFLEPGWGKIACNFTVHPYGDGLTLLTYECRTVTTDAASRRKFARYWRLTRPVAAHMMRAALTTIADHAVQAQANLAVMI